MGTRVMCSTPPAITHSYCPAITAMAAKLAACWPEPHIRSSVVPQTSSGKPALSAALRAMFMPCSPTWSTQPITTSSTSAGSILTRSTRALSVSARRSSGRTPASLPFFLPTAVRAAPTNTAFAMALLDDVVDPREEGVRGRLELREPVERLDPSRELGMRRGEGGRLAREGLGLPVQDRAEQRGRLVIEVVPGGHHRVAVLERRPVHEVALGEPTGRAGWTARDLLDLGDGRAHRLRHALDVELLAARAGEGLAPGPGLLRVVEDAQVEIEAGRPVPVLDEHVPEGQRVLAPRHGHEDRLVAREHPALVDRLGDLLLEELDEVRRAERGAAAPELERGGAPALPARP